MISRRTWFKQLRKNAGLTQSALSNLTKIGITSINKYELGIRNPNYSNAKKLAEILKFDWTKFYEDDAKGVK